MSFTSAFAASNACTTSRSPFSEAIISGDNTVKSRYSGRLIIAASATPAIRGASVATNRKKGFDEAIAKHSNIKMIRSQTGDFTRAKGKEVTESFLKAENGGKNICALYSHNDDMAVGAIQAIKEAGLKPGKDILVVSIDAVPDIFKAFMSGEANATVELTPNMAGPAFDALIAFKEKATVPPKWIQTDSKLYTPTDDPQKIYDSKKGLGY